MTRIAVVNPTTGQLVEFNIEGLTHAELETLPLDEQICKDVEREVAPCLPEEFLAAYVIQVGAVEAGISVLGSWLESRVRDWVNLDPELPEQSA